jgi:hypothetical protein
MCLLLGTSWVFIFQKTAFFKAANISNLECSFAHSTLMTWRYVFPKRRFGPQGSTWLHTQIHWNSWDIFSRVCTTTFGPRFPVRQVRAYWSLRHHYTHDVTARPTAGVAILSIHDWSTGRVNISVITSSVQYCILHTLLADITRCRLTNTCPNYCSYHLWCHRAVITVPWRDCTAGAWLPESVAFESDQTELTGKSGICLVAFSEGLCSNAI